MKKGYWLVRADVTDAEQFGAYAAKTPDALSKFGGQFIVRAGGSMLAEGNMRSRNSVIEFPSYQAAIDCWNSAEYQSAKTLRVGAAELDIVIIEGFGD